MSYVYLGYWQAKHLVTNHGIQLIIITAGLVQ